MSDHPEPEPYVEAHLSDALATDPRVGELGIHVHLDGDLVSIDGVVPTAERKKAAEVVVRERLPDHVIVNHIIVEELTPAEEPENLS